MKTTFSVVLLVLVLCGCSSSAVRDSTNNTTYANPRSNASTQSILSKAESERQAKLQKIQALYNQIKDQRR